MDKTFPRNLIFPLQALERIVPRLRLLPREEQLEVKIRRSILGLHCSTKYGQSIKRAEREMGESKEIAEGAARRS